MFIKRQTLILILVISVIVLISCEKQLFDYRNKYLGNWKFEVSYDHEVFNTTQGFHDTTEVNIYLGEIKYCSEDNKISFESTNYTEEFTITKAGNIFQYLD
jgi:hypothetical protein